MRTHYPYYLRKKAVDRTVGGSVINIIVLIVILFGCSSAASAQERYAVLIGGLGGSPEYSEKFEQYLFDSRKGLIENFGFSEDNVRVLAETSIADRSFVDQVATSDNIRTVFADLSNLISLSNSSNPSDLILVILFGHGSYDGKKAMLNIPRRDLSDLDYAGLLDALPTGNIVFINTASASGPFIRALSNVNRVVISATKTGGQTNETLFPKYLADGLSGSLGDLDRDGNVSVGELFRYAAENTAKEYEAANLLATEHALLEDTGDGRGYEYDMLEANLEGNLAAIIYVNERSTAAAITSLDGVDLVKRRADLEREISGLKSAKSTFQVDAYYSELEILFVELARVSDQMEGL